MTSKIAPEKRGFFKVLGPAIIVASVVLGPGSILSATKVGAEFGYSLIWVLVLASILMVSMIALSARIGVGLKATPCQEIADRLGRPWAMLIGVILFLVVVSFQTSNNFAVLAALEPFAGEEMSRGTKTIWLVVLNGLIILTLYLFRRLYGPVEKLMMLLVMAMIFAFVANIILAGPSLTEAAKGLVPSLPTGLDKSFFPSEDTAGKIIDPLWAVQALVATTLSVAGAFYQAYLVREKGWNTDTVKRSTVDSVAGIAVLGGITLLIMMTSAALFYGKNMDLGGTTAIAQQLEPLLGPNSKTIFGVGIFAAAFSSFMVNAMIGGLLLSDGLGLGGSIDSPWARHFTTVALVFSMAVALTFSSADRIVGLIIFAQALTVLGGPALAAALLYLGTRKEMLQSRLVGVGLITAGVATLILSIILAVRTAVRLGLTLF